MKISEGPSLTFVGGKGGVGKTTCAAMLAMASARSDRTLLISTDPASSLSSILDTTVGSKPRAVRGAARLWAANVDPHAAFSAWFAPRRDVVASIALEGTYLDSDDVDRLLNLSLPGIDEVVGLLEICKALTRAPHPARIIVDTAPTGHTLRLLSSPALFARLATVLDALQAHHRTVVSALRGSYREEPADRLIAQIEHDAASMAEMLRDRRSTELVWVTLPEPAALEETADALRFLEAAGMHVSTLIVNRLTPAPKGESCGWCDARRRFEARALAPLTRRFAGRDLQSLPEFDREPRGTAELRDAGRALAPYEPPRRMRPVEQRVRAVLSSPRSNHFPLIDLVGGARWILFGGKGGVGKSTCAAAASLELAAADAGTRVLLLSTDPAHSLGDIFGVRLGDSPRPIEGAPPNLLVREIDAVATFERFKREYIDSFDAAFGPLAKSGADDRDAFRRLVDLAPPGIDEVMAVAEVAAALLERSGPDRVVTDTAPTGHALRLLQTPAVLREWTQALLTILLKYRELAGAGSLGALVVDLSKRLRALHAVLTDPALTRFLIVTRAAAAPMEESHALQRALDALGITTAGIIVNAVGAGACRHCLRVRATQAESVRRLQARGRAEESEERSPSADQCAIIETPAEVPPPHGPDALVRWSHEWRRP